MIGLGQGGGGGESGGNCLKYLKRVWNRKEGRKKYSVKGRSRLGQGVDALNRGGRGGGLEPSYKLYGVFVEVG